MKPRILIYVNSHVGHHLDKPLLKRFLNDKIGHKSWEFFGDIIIPSLIKDSPEFLITEFFHGVSTQQYTTIQKGGTFVNPMLYGLHNDFSLWVDILHNEPEFYQEILFIDIPYEVYNGAVTPDDDYHVDEETYDRMTDIIKKMVKDTKDAFYPTGREIH